MAGPARGTPGRWFGFVTSTAPAPGGQGDGRAAGSSTLNARGSRIRDRRLIERIEALAIPPAWQDVWICPDPLGHIQATGVDDAGRLQYLYHESWRARRDAEKFERMLDFAHTLPAVRRKAARRLRGDGLTRERVLSWAILMLDRGLFRIGGDEYARNNGSYGLTTLERRHLRLGEGCSPRLRLRRQVGPAPADHESSIPPPTPSPGS